MLGTEETSVGPGVSVESWQSESAWPPSGGGIAANVPIPLYQLDILSQLLSATNRNVPDVAAVAQGVFIVSASCAPPPPLPPGASPPPFSFNCPQSRLVPGGLINSEEGTSASGPIWAAYTAILNQASAEQGIPAVGNLNGALYQIAASPQYESLVHDIQTGSNVNACGTGYSATQGWDAVTGLGTPTCPLISAVSNLVISSPSAVLITFNATGFSPTNVDLRWTPLFGPDGRVVKVESASSLFCVSYP
jgi:hypothetical protein